MGNASSFKAAGVILILVVGYFALSTLFRGNNTATEELEDFTDNSFTVLATKISPTNWQEVINIRGRTKAFRKVTVRSETNGVVEKTPVALGANVKAGEALCHLKIDARKSQLDQSRAARKKARLDFKAADELKKEGLGSDNALATAKAALDLADANYLQAKLSLDNTNLIAPFDGVFDTRMAEVGDFLSVGDPCGIVIQRSPFLIVGAVSEKQVGKIRTGDKGIATLATGETIEGKVRFVATAADPLTRTFDVELEVPNEGGNLRDGVTAQFQVFAKRRDTHLVKRSSLILDDNGAVGVRLVGAENIVEFAPVTLLGESLDGIHIGGLSGTKTLITRGQEFVSAGQNVTVQYDDEAE